MATFEDLGTKRIGTCDYGDVFRVSRRILDDEGAELVASHAVEFCPTHPAFDAKEVERGFSETAARASAEVADETTGVVAVTATLAAGKVAFDAAKPKPKG